MMFRNSVLVLLPVAFSLVSSSALPKDSSTKPRTTCWTGEIHSPCNGATAGCTPDGIMVRLKKLHDLIGGAFITMTITATHPAGHRVRHEFSGESTVNLSRNPMYKRRTGSNVKIPY
ncbi:hypothetical protein M434DRAFT_397563 [Hypoxylon sp. CO27-5]|nr:hypothetical protein M434DRAFT_397563 [Hypoxylon sp. CO27-5]